MRAALLYAKITTVLSESFLYACVGVQWLISTSVSVLETMEYKLIDEHDYFNDEFNGCEIIITGFLNGADDIDAQYNIVKDHIRTV